MSAEIEDDSKSAAAMAKVEERVKVVADLEKQKETTQKAKDNVKKYEDELKQAEKDEKPNSKINSLKDKIKKYEGEQKDSEKEEEKLKEMRMEIAEELVDMKADALEECV